MLAAQTGKPIPGSEEDLHKYETKCQQCMYGVMAKEELAEIGNDPCDTCGVDCRNWKPKEEVIDPRWKVCETCDNFSGNENCEHCKDNDRTSKPTRWKQRKVQL
jgi:hypothetical protein